MRDQRVNEVVHNRALTQAQRLTHAEQTLDEPAAYLTVATERTFPLQHRRTQGTLRRIVGRLDSRNARERPQRGLQPQHFLVNVTMSQLPARYREALEAKYVRGASVRNLTALWRSTEKAVESQLSPARKAFRAAFLTLSRSLGAELS